MFSLFDKDEDSVVKVTDIGPMLRSIGFNPSEVEIERLQEEQDTDNGTNCMDLQKYNFSSILVSTAAMPTSIARQQSCITKSQIPLR